MLKTRDLRSAQEALDAHKIVTLTCGGRSCRVNAILGDVARLSHSDFPSAMVERLDGEEFVIYTENEYAEVLRKLAEE